MFSFLKNHPFAVEALFKNSLVVTFAVPKEQLQKLIPECLTLDTFEDKWAFIAVAMVQTEKLRPKYFPKFLGNDFFLIGYRIFVRYTDNAGRRLRGLYILKSETDKRKMEILGNIFTHYSYTTTDILNVQRNNSASIKSFGSALEVAIEKSDEEISLPPLSPFPTWKEARRFAGPLPFTFTYDQATKKVLIIEGVRQNWQPEPVIVKTCKCGFINSLNLQDVRLASAFSISNVPYHWKKGKTEIWRP